MFPGPVCVALTPDTPADVFSADCKGADCVEVRLDCLGDPRASMEIRWDRLSLPVIATCRRVENGGCFSGSEDQEIEILQAALRNGAHWVDLDYRSADRIDGASVIASWHDFSGTPADLEGVTARVFQSGGAAAKVAVLTRTWADVRMLLDLFERKWPRPLIAVGMGITGQMTRVIGPSRGSALTFVNVGRESAPGQITVAELLGTYKFRSVRRTTRLIGIVGNPVGHSTSPELHNRALVAEGLDYVYLKFPVDSLADFFANAVEIGIAGFSVTIPHKVGVMRFLDRVSSEAMAVGAVNTVTRVDGAWAGENTDVHGARVALRDLDLARMRVVILGSGGAARAAVAATLDARSVTILSRSLPRGRTDWARTVEVDHPDHYSVHEAELLINATPVGMSPDLEASPVSGSIRAEVVFDMVYTPERTRLLRDAEDQGKRTISGRTMFLAQAARQFEIWTGRTADPQLFSGVA